MATLLFMRNAHLTLKLGAAASQSFQGQVSSAAVEVEAGDTVTYPVLDGTVPTQVGASTYALHLVAAQDWVAAEGLAAFLWANDGQAATFFLQAHGSGVDPTTTKPAVTGTVQLVAGSYGGEVNTYAEIDVTMPCATKPTLVTTGTIPTLAEAEPEAFPGAEVVQPEGAEAVPAEA